MAILDLKVDLTHLCSILERIANALDRAVPIVVQDPSKGLTSQDVIHADSKTVWARKQKVKMEERLKRASQLSPSETPPKPKS